MKHPAILAVLNQKGGVGKTTTVASLGPALAALGRRVLLIELDPQECLAEATGADADARPYTTDLIDQHADPATAQEVRPGLHVVVAGPELVQQEAKYLTQPLRALRALPTILAAKYYDCVILDCPPSLGIFSGIALAAATHVLVPVATSSLPVRRLPATLTAIREQGGPRCRLYGILPTIHAAHLLHHQEALAAIREISGKGVAVFDPIPRTVRLENAVANGTPITDASHPAGLAYTHLSQRIAKELL